MVLARQGMVATSQPLAARVGVDVLRAGGSAVDAAIAANAMLGLTEPTGCGIGGDLFAIVWDGQAHELCGLNASGRSPLGLTADYFAAERLTRIPSAGPLSVSVPGAVDGWFTLHERFGRLPMSELLAPAIEYARDGFPVTEIIAGDWAGEAQRFGDDRAFARVYLPNGRAPRAGEVFRNPALADAYQQLSVHGRRAFYAGDIAVGIEACMRDRGGFLTREDLAAHRSEQVAPVSTSYRGYDVWELPPNGQGIAVLQMLNMLEAFELGRLEFASARHLHLLIEAKKLAFEDRARYYADPAFVDVPVATLISKAYAASRRVLIRDDRALDAPPPGELDHVGDTVYLAAADSQGSMVSLIQSNFIGMGSGVTVPEFGFGLQSRGSAFALAKDHPNRYAPGKRPFHTIIPGFVTQHSQPLMAFGVMGAAMQPQGQVQVLTNMLDFGMNIQEAGDAPRIRHEGSSEPDGERMRGTGRVLVESQIPDGSVAELTALGHDVVRERGGYGGYQAIFYDRRQGVYKGASESRKDGSAIGY
jgi:gamma-glutamyltranspeptidase / glutathione hydrolase